MTQEIVDNSSLIGLVKIGSQAVLLYRTESDSSDVIKVGMDPTDNKNAIYQSVEGSITRPRFWTWEYWEKKGLPKEQMHLTDGEHKVTVYNYNEPLQPDQVATINRVLGMFAGIRDGEVFKHIDYILLDDAKPMNEKSGELTNGHGVYHARLLSLYPNVFADVPNRVTGKVSNLEGTLTHELAHGLSHVMLEGDMVVDMAVNKWRRIGNWRSGDERRILAGGEITNEVTSEPERCVTEYAKSDADEDMAESMVAALFDPEKLDPQKLQFLQANLPLDSSKQTTWNASLEDVKLPETPSEFRVKFLGKRIFTVKSRTDGK